MLHLGLINEQDGHVRAGRPTRELIIIFKDNVGNE